MNAHEFVDGLMLGMLFVIALFQLRFWRRTGDRLFLFFAVAFAVMAANRIALAVSASTSEPATSLYVVRLVAFIVILFAIWDKNRRQARTIASARE